MRLIRDVARSVRVDRIRRQKADLEDVLVHVHKETPEQARFRAGLTNPQERDAIMAEYEAMERKPVFTPWQVAVSEALRDGEAEKAIEAWHLRNRLHLCHDEEKTLTRLVDDWERHVRTQPGTSTVVLARTKAEGRALSWLMRQRVLARTPDAKRAVIEVSRDLDGRLTEPLEIAVGDRIRIGATQWEKQLFNGTVVTIEDLEVRRAEAAAVSRKARNRLWRRAPAEPDSGGSPEPEFSVHITARTDDGRRVTFRHDEIRDWHDNIRLDYGYAMTIASAQGLTVDRAFLLVDERPARETIYPAATRHREGLDIYVNRSPLAFDIAEHRPEDQADMPVTDSDVRAYLAERWSRSQPKEAALDYITDGEWRDASQGARRAPASRTAAARPEPVQWQKHGGPGGGQGEVAEARRCRERQRDRAHRPRNPPRGQRLAPRRGGGRVRGRARRSSRRVGRAARAGALGRRRGGAEPGLPRDPRSPRRADEAGTTIPCQAAGVRAAAGRARRDRQARDRGVRPGTCTGRQLPPLRRRQGGARAESRAGAIAGARAGGAPVETPARPPEPVAEARQPGEGEPRPGRPIPTEPESSPSPEHSEEAYRQLRIDWQRHAARAERSGMSPFDLDGAAELIRRIGEFANDESLPAEPRRRLHGLVRRYNRHLEAGARLEAWLEDADRHWQRFDSIYRRAHDLDVAPDTLRPFRDWLERNERLLQAGRAILDDPGTYGVHLDRMEGAKRRLRDAVSRMEGFSAERRMQARSQDRGPTRSL